MPKATKVYKREQGLTTAQLHAIDLLVTGKTDREVADIIGVNRVTVTKWRNYDVYFQTELNKGRKEILGASIDRIRALVPKAMERLEKEVKGEHGWKVALEVIKLAGIENKYIREIGHDEADEILTELAKKKMNQELFSMTSDYSKKQILEEYRGKSEAEI
ncbi:helix-turn-helix domain-containing protein [Radiobacillus sp. PE A8.2]|uniref:helix-turn-helix domain-containing protein n=1 Tax=Radiobacillus sp. PE A8.2 TaxID=3380349 RepID=UPI0038900115